MGIDASTEIFYFSGTGNSLFVAKELSERIPNAKITPMVACVEKNACVSNADSIGIVFPVHALTIPILVNNFLESLLIDNASYIFSAATRQGTVFRGFRKIERILKKKGKYLDAEFVVNMYGNDARHEFAVPEKADLDRIERETLQVIETISSAVSRRMRCKGTDSSVTIPTADSKLKAWLIETVVILLMDNAERFGGVNYFYHDGDCTGCGICERVCLSRKIRMERGEPIWNKRRLCYMCFACLNFCPKESVQIRSIPGVKSFSERNGRYPHPYAAITDMENQKA